MKGGKKELDTQEIQIEVDKEIWYTPHNCKSRKQKVNVGKNNNRFKKVKTKQKRKMPQ